MHVDAAEYDVVKITVLHGIGECLMHTVAVLRCHPVKEGIPRFGHCFGFLGCLEVAKTRAVHFARVDIDFPATHLCRGHRQRQALLTFAQGHFGNPAFQCHLYRGMQFALRKRL